MHCGEQALPQVKEEHKRIMFHGLRRAIFNLVLLVLWRFTGARLLYRYRHPCCLSSTGVMASFLSFFLSFAVASLAISEAHLPETAVPLKNEELKETARPRGFEKWNGHLEIRLSASPSWRPRRSPREEKHIFRRPRVNLSTEIVKRQLVNELQVFVPAWRTVHNYSLTNQTVCVQADNK